jgi:hypothetical protein
MRHKVAIYHAEVVKLLIARGNLFRRIKLLLSTAANEGNDVFRHKGSSCLNF